MDKSNPYAAPLSEAEPPDLFELNAQGILGEAWKLYTENFLVIASVVVTVWIPVELFSSYMDYHVFDPDDFRKSFRLARLLDNLFGIIATAAVISIGAKVTSGHFPSYGGALAHGLGCWGRMFWTRLLVQLAVVLSFLLLIIPGIYVATRICLAEIVVVREKLSGGAAISRSFELTRGQFWLMFRLAIVAALILAVVVVAVVLLPVIVFPEADNMATDAISQIVADVFAAYYTLCFFCAHRRLINAVEAAPNLGTGGWNRFE